MPTEPHFLLPPMHQPTQSAQARWQSIILADAEFVPNDPIDDLTSGRFGPNYTYYGSVDDIIIFYELATLPPLVLGSAGPTYARGNWQPYAGTMRFSIDYFNSNDITEEVILHEMAHALGFGTVSAREKGKERLELP